MKILENLCKYDIILGSGSPRRRQLLSELGIRFRVCPGHNHDESYPPGLTKNEIPVYLARAKAQHMHHLMLPRTLLITADTIVWLDDAVINKPADEHDAICMLHTLSAKTHEVVTGICICTTEKELAFHVNSRVTFARLTDEEIEYYVRVCQPFDKAGAYGIQDWIGFIGIETIEGSFYNVMGLPVQRLYQELKKF